MTTWIDEIDDRQQKEVELARVYARDYHHGTDGHHRMLLIARLAELLDRQAGQAASTEDLYAVARQCGAAGIWCIRGAQGAALIYTDDLVQARQPDTAASWPALSIAPPHELIIVLRFPAGDGGAAGVEFR